MTAHFWLSTAQTVVFLALTAWAWWATRRIAELLNHAEVIRAHTEAGAQYANRAALDARQMLDVLAEWWQQMREQQPETEPHPIVGPETVPESEAVGRIADVELAYEFARIEDILHRPVKPSPRPRKRAAA